MSVPREDFKKTYRVLYAARAEPVVFEAPELRCLTIDGTGSPESEAWTSAVAALYASAYAVRGALKAAGILEYSVLPLEGQWWPGDGLPYEESDRDAWCWTMIIPQPPQADDALVRTALETAARKKPALPVPSVRFGPLHEGTCAQILHVGPFADEPSTLAKLYAFLDEQGLAIAGKHHEIYLSDFRRTAPDRLKTLLRYPVRPVTRERGPRSVKPGEDATA
ncbi:GyrI-like domain-containing protein [Actinocorallia sp. API 0066]|uniref:GyrI-like domain-containing protein n=1 Tax=Actinocorallia sp. API 0066 TaxID=2896846 RepID=UPI001E409270|nr:GyrI-like domain-containing protein [Actinocorallia sp. API 0066]MCD0452098.1 GyrI-like domain-containing protein [Actinocorallia sp. API 0066]